MTLWPTRWCRALGLSGVFSSWVFLSCTFLQLSAAAAEAPLLQPGEIASGTLVPSEVAHFPLDLPADFALRLVVVQRGMDVTTSLLDGDGRKLAVADRNLGEDGDEWLEVITPATAIYHLEVAASSTVRPAGSFTILLDHLRPATERDRQVAEAFEIFSRGTGLLPTEDKLKKEGADREALLLDAAARFESLEHPLYEAEARTRLIRHASSYSEHEALWREALALFQRADDATSQAWVHNGLSRALISQDRYGEAEDQYRASLEITRTVPDRIRRAIALDGIGKAAANQGRIQEALDRLEEALDLWRDHEFRYRSSTRHELGVVYLWQLHQPHRAIQYLQGALDDYHAMARRGAQGMETSIDKTLGQLAQAYLELGDLAQARDLLLEAWDQQPPESCRVIPTLTKLAALEQREGAPASAPAYLLQAAQNLAQGCPREESSVWLAQLAFSVGQKEPEDALLAADRCGETFQRRGDPLGRAVCDSGRARALRLQGNLKPALEAASRALAAFEETRPDIDRRDLRTAFFAGVQEIFDVQIALLLDLGEDRAAFEAAERARARSLRDGLREAGGDIRRDADPDLLRQEQNLRQRLNELDERTRATTPGSDRATALQNRLRETLEALEAARGEIRRKAPEFASLVEQRPISAAQIQRALAADHLLLKVHLDEEESTLWAVTRDDLQSFRLPSRALLEALAQEAREQLMSLRRRHRSTSLCRLSELVLEPALSLLPGRSLILALDGALEELPFAALPLPSPSAACAEAPFLGEAHEILHLSSASLLVERPWAGLEEDDDRPWIAMVADPVYTAQDERLGTGGRTTANSKPAASAAESSATESSATESSGGINLARLPHSAAEAEAVLARVPEHRRVSMLGTHARRDSILQGALFSARIVHFAVHGVHEAQPLRSYLALSEYGSQGDPISGRLSAYELYDLDLSADLVVLSACESGAGTQARGEGVVSGLVRGFFYAGADRILASLWPVPDSGTAQLMGHFYGGLLDDGLSPTRALQQAQKKMRAEGAPPRTWAAFVLQGSPEPLSPFLP